MTADREAAIRAALSWCEETSNGERHRERGLEALNSLMSELAAARERCPFCGHEWRRHDPEDGQCDAHTDEPGEFGACKCGRDLGWMQVRIAALSSAALEDEG